MQAKRTTVGLGIVSPFSQWSVARVFPSVPLKAKSLRPYTWTEVECIECDETWQGSRLINYLLIGFHYIPYIEDKAISFYRNSQLPENEKLLLPPRRAGLLFWNVARPQSREIRYKSYQLHVSSTFLTLISANGAVLAIYLQIYLETSSLQRESVPKLPTMI